MLWRLFHKSAIHEYCHGEKPWAVVTGSTDGIGKELARVLLESNFNVLLHGRSEEKLKKLSQGFKLEFPHLDLAVVVADASKPDTFANIVEALQGKHVTVFINNVPYSEQAMNIFADDSAAQVQRGLDMGVQFVTKLTHGVLPILIKNGPSLLINNGSLVAAIPGPYLAVYASSKAYLKTFTNCLAIESKRYGQGVEVLYMDIHNVNSGGNKTPVSFTTPSSNDMAKAIIRAVGCGKTEVTPYWTHELMRWIFPLVPNSVLVDTIATTLETTIKKQT
ncbi:NAD(P)-binding protein [Sistotremastrum suecicum HHB10207 ss-3]|uniref:NAD(P)-binding protein n=1 Tax=Sistotremastrum suecicum HHB10207 ss-3 TaxID=1314776 RepID=A0A166IS96_9AGAM|nr:NAD(P)-binding protein [Sistotremastrum suecicum HHB10207 ss-3]